MKYKGRKIHRKKKEYTLKIDGKKERKEGEVEVE
jgi:hypothetical protein